MIPDGDTADETVGPATLLVLPVVLPLAVMGATEDEEDVDSEAGAAEDEMTAIVTASVRVAVVSIRVEVAAGRVTASACRKAMFVSWVKPECRASFAVSSSGNDNDADESIRNVLVILLLVVAALDTAINLPPVASSSSSALEISSSPMGCFPAGTSFPVDNGCVVDKLSELGEGADKPVRLRCWLLAACN